MRLVELQGFVPIGTSLRMGMHVWLPLEDIKTQVDRGLEYLQPKTVLVDGGGRVCCRTGCQVVCWVRTR